MKQKPVNNIIFTKKTTFFVISLVVLFIIEIQSVYSQDWKTSFDSTMYYFNKENNTESLTWALKAKAQAVSQFGYNSKEHEKTLYKLVDILFANDKLDSAFMFAQEDSSVAFNVYGQLSQEFVGTLNNLGLIYCYILFQPNSAETVLLEAKSKLDAMPDRSDSAYAFTINNLALVYEQLGKFQQAEPLYSNSIEIIKRLEGEKSSNYAETVHNLAALYRRMGLYKKSDTLFQKSIDIYKNIYGEKHLYYATELNNIGDLYKFMGRYDEAEPIYKQAVKIRKDILGAEHPDYAKTISNLGHLYFQMGRYDQAEDLFKQALDIQQLKRGINNPDYAATANNLALLQEQRYNYKESEKIFLKVLDIFDVLYTKKHPNYATALDNLARVYKKMKLYAKSEEMFFLAKEIRKQLLGDKHPSYANTLFNLASLYEIIGQYPLSETLYLEVLRIRKEKLGTEHPDYAKNLSGLAGLYYKWRKFDEAEPYFKEALDKYLYQVRRFFPYMSEKEKLQFWTSVSGTFEDFDAFCSAYFSFKPEIVSNMYNNLLVTKGLILSSTKKVLSKIRQSKDTSVTNILNRWQDAKDLWLLLVQKPEKAKEFNVNVDSIAELANELEKELSSKSEDFKNAFNAKDITWQDVQKTLKQGEAAVEIIRFKKEVQKVDDIEKEVVYYAALIIKQTTKNHPEIAILNNGNELEDDFVKLYGNLVKILKILPIKERSPFEMELLENDQKELYKQFWERISEKIKGIKKVFLSVDGVYNSINLMTLVNPKTGKYLIEELDLRIVTNTKDLIEYSKAKKGILKNTAVLIGAPLYNLNKDADGWVPPLPGTKIEVERISSDMLRKRWDIKAYLEKDALERTLKEINNPKILHIATHGMFLANVEGGGDNNLLGINAQQLDENPLLRSMLLFAGVENKSEENTTDDGKLTAYEAMDLNLDNTDIVVLSACETGLGQIQNGEGVYGLQRAFQVAGAKSLIMSLWTVSDDATQHLMTKFYEKILSGIDKRKAFREAQIDLKKTYPEFYYWGAFVMVGE